MTYNYVVGCWGGERRRIDNAYITDPLYYIKANVAQLTKLTHSLDQITFVVNDNGNETYNNYMGSLSDIGETKVKVLFRENLGMSYGAWAHAYETYGTEFDYYIFMEDDYVPNLDNFDNVLKDMLLEKDLDFLCGKYTDHAACANGIAKSESIKVIYDKGGELPYPKTFDYGTVQHVGQVGLSHAFTNIGLKVHDYSDRYSTVFEQVVPLPQYLWVDTPEKYPIVVPVNYMMELNKC